MTHSLRKPNPTNPVGQPISPTVRDISNFGVPVVVGPINNMALLDSISEDPELTTVPDP